jgi:hypothetical protein
VVYRVLLKAGIGLILVAGFTGGIVASSLPYFARSENVYEERTGPLWFVWWPIRWWTYVEHAAFWSALLFVLRAFVVARLGA